MPKGEIKKFSKRSLTRKKPLPAAQTPIPKTHPLEPDDMPTVTSVQRTHLLLESHTADLNHDYSSPQPKGIPKKFITNPKNESTANDTRIFFETQVKRLFRWLLETPTPSIFQRFLIAAIPKMIGVSLKDPSWKLTYFHEGEDQDRKNIYKDEHMQKPLPRKVKDGCEIQNLGHASQLIQTSGLNILTDPVFGKAIGPSSYLLRKISGLFYPAKTEKFDIRKLPKIDVIVISHNHYDHVDEPSLKALIQQFKERGEPQPTVLVPRGDKRLFEKMGFTKVKEMEWHDEISLSSNPEKPDAPKVTFTCVPADHRSGRADAGHHQSLTAGWVISPKERKEILYFAGDTARLDDNRMATLATDIYAMYQHKKGLDSNQLPVIVNMEPGGPNYTRRDMEPTHQSAVDSINSAFRLAAGLAKLNKHDNDKNPDIRAFRADEWLNSIATVFIHHNMWELGPDRFNENVFIFNRMLRYLNMNDTQLTAEKTRQETKKDKWAPLGETSLFHRRKGFIIDGVRELRTLAKEIWPDDSDNTRNKRLIEFLNARVHFPLIGERIKAEDATHFALGETSTIKPDTQKGLRPKGM